MEPVRRHRRTMVLMCIIIIITQLSLSYSSNIRKRAVPHFSEATKMGIVDSNAIEEASGLAESRVHPGILYTLNDHGNSDDVFAVDIYTGNRIATLDLIHATNTDWEDIAVGPCHGSKSCIFVGDTGEKGNANTIYRILEPEHLHNADVQIDSTLEFHWSESDTETVMVDPDGEVYIVSKVHEGHHAKIGKLPSSAWGSGHQVTVTETATLPIVTSHNDPVGGDISPDGTEVLLKTHENIYYWHVQNKDYLVALTSHPYTVPYKEEPQGESVCWDMRGSGYYTLSEGRNQPIYYYKRL